MWALKQKSQFFKRSPISHIYKKQKNCDKLCNNIYHLDHFWVYNRVAMHIHNVCSHEMKRRLLLVRKAMTNLDSILKQKHYFANKGPSSQSYGFSSSHLWI